MILNDESISRICTINFSKYLRSEVFKYLRTLFEEFSGAGYFENSGIYYVKGV